MFLKSKDKKAIIALNILYCNIISLVNAMYMKQSGCTMALNNSHARKKGGKREDAEVQTFHTM